MNDNNNMINNEKNVNPLNINTNDISNNNDNSTPLKKVYSNMTSSSQSRKLSSLEEKLSAINSPPDIENYYKSLKTENQGVIPQIHRMELLQRKINLLQNSSNQNSKSLQEILELEMNERLRYPKYTIIQNTPLTPHEEIVNEILKKKFGPGGGYSMNYPTVVFKNQEEINEMKNKQNLKNLNNNNNNNNAVGNKVTFQSNENRPITVKMLKEIQQEILNLRKALSELKIGFKEMKEQMKIMKSEDEHKNTLMIEMIRKIIENGGDTKLKASMESVFDKKKIDLSKIKTDLEGFKEEELTDIIKNEIKIYDEEKDIILSKQIEELKKMINENKILNNNDNNKIEGFEDFLKIEEKEKIESRKESKNQTNKGSSKSKKDDEEKSGSKSKSTKSKKRKKKRKNKKRSKTSSNEEEEEEEDDDESENESDEEEENETSEGKSKSTKTKKTNKKSSKNSGSEEEEEDDESESDEESESKTSKTSKTKKKSKYNKSSTSKSKSSETNEEDEDSKNSHTESENHSGSKSKSRTSTTKGNKSKSKKSNNKKISKKSETIDERESEDNDSNDSSDEEKSKSTQKKSQKNNAKSLSKKESSNKKSSSNS